MNAKYLDFLSEYGGTSQRRIEAFTSGILTPDPKAIVLWSMEEGIDYRSIELYKSASEFAGGTFPIRAGAVWSYCQGNTPDGGSLYHFGLVEKDEETFSVLPGRLITATYAKTSVGADFGDAIAARALRLSGVLTSKYRSMVRIFGNTHKRRNATTRRGFAVYKVIKLLVRNPGMVYRKADIAEETGLSVNLLSPALNSMGGAGVIEYESPSRERKGKSVTGWVHYRLIDKGLLKKDPEELYAELRKERPKAYLRTYLRLIIEHMKDDPKGLYSDLTPENCTIAN